VGHKARWEYFRAIYGCYQKGDRKARQAILNEFCLNTGYHRKYAIRLLNGASPGPQATAALGVPFRISSHSSGAGSKVFSDGHFSLPGSLSPFSGGSF
jgi:hypothetical protein